MKKIKILTPSRGFLKTLYNAPNDYFYFEENKYKDRMYEVNSKLKKVLNKVAKSYLFDFLGIIKTHSVKGDEIGFSYNKFVKYTNNYIIYLETPYALGHYSTRKFSTYLGRKNISKMINNPKLKKIVCVSDSCRVSLENMNLIPDKGKITRIYPLIENSSYSLKSLIAKKESTEYLTCLFVSSQFNIKGGREILELISRIEKNDLKIKMTIVTPINLLNDDQLDALRNSQMVNLVDYNLSEKEMIELYAETHILLNPTRMESFGLVLLESMKQGCVVFSTDLFAVEEIVENGINGFLFEPKMRFYNKNKTANEAVWMNREKTIYRDYVDEQLVNEIFRKMIMLEKDRKLLISMIEESYMISNKGKFDYDQILEQWESIFNDL